MKVDQLTRDAWPWHRPTGKSRQDRYQATGQLLRPAVGSDQWDVAVHGGDLYLLKPTLGKPKEIPALNQGREGCNHPAIPRSPSPISFPEGIRLRVTIVVKCWPLAICSWSVQCYRKVVAYIHSWLFGYSFETVPETCMVEFLEFLHGVGFFYLIWMVRHSIQ